MQKPHQDIPVVILAGGQGTRLREETAFRPKPMVEVGGRPILWHVMKIYDHFGFHRFVVPVGYLGDMIKDVLPLLRPAPRRLHRRHGVRGAASAR